MWRVAVNRLQCLGWVDAVHDLSRRGKRKVSVVEMEGPALRIEQGTSPAGTFEVVCRDVIATGLRNDRS